MRLTSVDVRSFVSQTENSRDTNFDSTYRTRPRSSPLLPSPAPSASQEARTCSPESQLRIHPESQRQRRQERNRKGGESSTHSTLPIPKATPCLQSQKRKISQLSRPPPSSFALWTHQSKQATKPPSPHSSSSFHDPPSTTLALPLYPTTRRRFRRRRRGFW